LEISAIMPANSISRVLGKLIVAQLVKKFPTFYGTQGFFSIYIPKHRHAEQNFTNLRVTSSGFAIKPSSDLFNVKNEDL
jgi:hypothetical protein